MLYILLAIGVVFALLFYFGPLEPMTAGTPNEAPRVTNSMLTYGYILVIIAGVLALAFPLAFMITHPAKAKFVLLGVAAFVLILFIGWLLGSGAPMKGAEEMSAGGMKLVDGGLKAAYIFLGLTFAGIIFSEISSVFR